MPRHNVTVRLTLGLGSLAAATYGVATAPIGIMSLTWLTILVAAACVAGDAALDLIGER